MPGEYIILPYDVVIPRRQDTGHLSLGTLPSAADPEVKIQAVVLCHFLFLSLLFSLSSTGSCAACASLKLPV